MSEPEKDTPMTDEEAFEQMVAEDPELNDGESEVDDGDDPAGEGDDPGPEQEAEGTQDDPDEPETPDEEKPEGDDDDLPPWIQALEGEAREQAKSDWQDWNLTREQNRILELRYKSQHGQLKPMQQQNERLRRQVRDMARGLQGADVPGRAERFKDLKKWTENHAKDFPEEAAELQKFIDQAEQEADRLSQENQQYRQRMQQEPPEEAVNRDEQQNYLLELHPEAPQLSVDPQFAYWIERQDEATKMAIQSDVAADVSDVLTQFKQQNPDWHPPQEPDDFLNIRQAAHSPLFQEWAQAYGVQPAAVLNMSEFEQAQVLRSFKAELGEVYAGMEGEGESDDDPDEGQDNAPDPKALRARRQREQQMKDRSPGHKPAKVQGSGLPTDEEELFEYLVETDPELQDTG